MTEPLDLVKKTEAGWEGDPDRIAVSATPAGTVDGSYATVEPDHPAIALARIVGITGGDPRLELLSVFFDTFREEIRATAIDAARSAVDSHRSDTHPTD
jgi:hypothetical protein